MPGDVREIGLDETARAPVAGDTQATQPALAIGTHDTAAAEPAPVASTARWPRVVYMACAALGTGMLAYFLVRFVIASDPPQLHRKFVGEAHGRFGALDVFNGPYLTLVRMSSVAVIYLAICAWAARSYRRDLTAQLVCGTASIASVYSVAVAVLTSHDTNVAPRLLAACVYVALPGAAFVIASLFPNGRPTPKWSLYLVPVACVPFVLQAIYMFREHEFSVPLAASYFPFAALYFAFQWRRYRTHATVRERYQIRWVSYAAAVFVVLQAIAVIVFIPLLGRRDGAFPFYRIVFELLLASSYLAALVSLLFSAARFRVWDVDRVINRTLVYLLVSALLAAASVVTFFALRVALADLPRLASLAISLAIVVALAAPARRIISRWIDRKVYGIGLDYEALAAKAVRATTLPTTGNEFASYDDLVLLGRGGMGAVYRAHHADFGVPVALKVMSPQLAQDPDAQARFKRESQILEDLQHPNVIPYLASGHEAGLAFIAMQYIDGEDLASVVRRRGPLPLAEAASAIANVAAALDVAHARGVVHRDIKPANIFVEGSPKASLLDRRALVMDFGVARIANDPNEVDVSLVGSLPYIAPEQIHDADQADARADVYALGATAYELVTGRPPFVESSALGLVLAHLHQPPADPRTLVPSLPAPAAAAILHALAKDPAQRPPSASAFARALATSSAAR